MKLKVIVGLLVLMLVSLLVLSGCPQPAAEPVAPAPAPAPEAPGQTWTLDFATFWSATDFQVVEGHEVWMREISDRVAAETNHTINFTMHPGGVLLGPRELYEGAVAGAADIVTTAPAYTPGVFPLSEVFELPGFNNDNALVASLTVNEAFKQSPELQQEFDDTKIMFFWATGPGDFMTTTPVRTLEDLAGLEIRAVGGTVPSVTALGATPVSMPMSDAYIALDTGIADGILAPTDTLQGFRLAEVTGYITKTPFVYNIVFVKAMNLDTWNAFPPEVQQIFNEVNEKFVMEYGKLRTDHTVAGQEYAIQNFGHEVIELTADENARWIDILRPLGEEWINKTNAAGLPGNAMFDLASSLDARFSQEHGGYGR